MFFDFNEPVDSAYNLGISIKGGPNILIETYLNELLSKFTAAQNISTYTLSFDQIFTDKEFNKHIPDENDKSFINKHFYPKLFGDLKKNNVFDPVKNKDILVFDYKVKVCFTLDKSLTPMRCSSGVIYGTLNLGYKPVLYYLWVDIQSIINQLKSN